MRRRICVFFVLLSLFGLASTLSAQQTGQAGSSGLRESGFQLDQNYPNPFNPETKIPFVLGEDLFVEGVPVVVSIRIFNVLQQFVAAPTALGHPSSDGLPVIALEYPTSGPYEAYWDGRNSNGQKVASGIYFMQMTVNGRSQVKRMFVTK